MSGNEVELSGDAVRHYLTIEVTLRQKRIHAGAHNRAAQQKSGFVD